MSHKIQSPSSLYLEREKDFRVGALVYQVIVDRFVPSANLAAKKNLYLYPKRLMGWNDLPKPGHFMEDVKYWSHELDYFGGDLKSLMTQIKYLQDLGIDVLYLNPICESLSNHKYDASDYLKISPEYGTMEDLTTLAKALHGMGKKLMLDGVFNHMGVSSPLFQQAKDPKSLYHSWFYFGPQYPQGVRLWADAKSLPELNLENDAVKDYIYRSEKSVIRSYLKAGIDGWRLDVAFDIGYQVLKELTEFAHLEKPGSMIVGETWNYPTQWLQSIDGVMNFTLREIIFNSISGEFHPQTTNRLLERLVDDAGIEGLLKSWVLLDNHDTVRLNHRLPSIKDQKLAQVMQFTFPGAPNLYYGTELGMTGGNDPENRAPMRWDLVTNENPQLQWTKQLIQLHQTNRALKVGDYLAIEANQLVAYERYTDKVEDTILVLINPQTVDVHEKVMVRDSSLMNVSNFEVLLGEAIKPTLIAGILEVKLPAKSFVVLKPVTKPTLSYTPYKRV